MLVEQTMEKLVAMKLHGMADALRSWLEKPKDRDLAPADLVGLLADAEWTARENNKLTARLRNAKFRQQACMEDIDYAHPRGLTKAVMLDLTACRWVGAHQNVIITGATGLGKSYLACALGHRACREGHTSCTGGRLASSTSSRRPAATGRCSRSCGGSRRPRCSSSTTSGSRC